MVFICLEYVEGRAETLYIHCSLEKKLVSSSFFYCINGKLVERHKLNDALGGTEGFRYDTSGDRQSGVLNIINDNIVGMLKLCEEYDREMPTEIKLIYNVVENSLKADYRYDMVYSNDTDKSPDDVSMEWFDEIKSNM
ncbi:DUF600 domain-containing protein [Bacillus sp. A301a_S52]|nr:DUF600 domain-containing protein [Bacillus sp. A301a_S52]